MAQINNLTSAIEKALSIDPSIENDVISTINERLADHGVKLAYEGGKISHVTRKVKPSKGADVASAKPPKRRRGRKKEGERSNKDAILEALRSLEGPGNSTQLHDKLSEIGHSIEKASMHTVLSSLVNDGLVKKTGKRRNYMYSTKK